jgi:hypothetical protein
MERIKVIHDTVGHTLKGWLGDPRSEYVSALTDDEVVVKDNAARILGFELLHYRPSDAGHGLTVEASILPAVKGR